MTKKLYYPAIHCVREQCGQFRASSAIMIRSYTSPLLLQDEINEQQNRKIEIYKNHLEFLGAIACWPESVDITLNIFTRPNTDYPMGGTVETALVISVTGNGKQAVQAEVLARHSALFSLLNNFFPAIEFNTVVTEKKLSEIMLPFAPAVVTGIQRRCENFVVSRTKKGTGRIKETIGFLPKKNTKKTTNCTDCLEIPYLFSWIATEHQDISLVAEAMLLTPSPLWFQVRLRTMPCDRQVAADLRQALHTCEDLLNSSEGDENSILLAQLKALRNALTERLQQINRPTFKGGIFLASTSEIDEALAGAVAACISSETVARNDEDVSLFGGTSFCEIQPGDFLKHMFVIETEPFTPEVASCMFRIPHPLRPDVPGLPIKGYRTGFADPALLDSGGKKGVIIGDNVHRGFVNPIHLSTEDRMKHTFILGQTGTGKSSIISMLASQDIRDGHGLCLIDPHGDLIEEILHLYPEERKNDLVLVDFLDRDHIIPMNLLDWQQPEERDFIIDEIYCWLDRTYDMRETGGPMFELYFRSFMRVLMSARKGDKFIPTITDYNRMFIDRKFRNYCQRNVTDRQVLRTMKQAMNAGGDASLDNIAPYITSKFNRFVLDTNVQRIAGQENMAIDFTDIMENRKVMLVNLGRGRYGETITSLLASQIVARFKAATMKRADIPAAQRKDFFLYVDEFQNISSQNFSSLLSEARKYRVGLILANQYADQLDDAGRGSRGDSVLRALLGNVGTIINFRLGVKDAELMEPVFTPDFNKTDLAALPRGACYLNLKSGGNKPISISLQTRYRKSPQRPDHVAHLRKAAMKRHAITRKQADKNIKRRNEKIDALLKEDNDNSQALHNLLN